MIVFLCLWRRTMTDILNIIIIVSSNPKAQFLMFYLHIFNEVTKHSKLAKYTNGGYHGFVHLNGSRTLSIRTLFPYKRTMPFQTMFFCLPPPLKIIIITAYICPLDSRNMWHKKLNMEWRLQHWTPDRVRQNLLDSLLLLQTTKVRQYCAYFCIFRW